MDDLTFTNRAYNQYDPTNAINDCNILKGTEFISQNCDSLNFSTFNSNHAILNSFHGKINSTLRKSNQIVMLQDIRCVNRLNRNRIRRELATTPYGNFEVFINSRKNKRGVMIAINRKLNYKILNTYFSSDENVILIDLTLNDFRLTIGTVYGPYESDNPNFFSQVKQKLPILAINISWLWVILMVYPQLSLQIMTLPSLVLTPFFKKTFQTLNIAKS